MSRPIALLLALFLSIPLLAQNVELTTQITPALLIVEAGDTRGFTTSLSNYSNVQASDVHVVYTIAGEATFDSLAGHEEWTCAIEAKRAECVIAYGQLGTETFNVSLRAGAANGSSSTLTMTATAAQPVFADGRNVATATLQVFNTHVVETTADSGPGSLRAAIEAANAQKTIASKIEFRIPAPVPAEGWFTIIPASPLPPIVAERMFVDGKSQTRFTGDTNTRGPEIAIDGHLAHRGLEVHSPCLARVEGLAIGNFDENYGLLFTKSGTCSTPFAFGTDQRLVADNYLGTDPTGTVAWPNLRGIHGDFGSGTIRNNVISGNKYSGMWIWVSEDRDDAFLIELNKIGTAPDGITPLPNGAAGMLLGDRVSANVRRNVIANHPGMGIALVRGETYVLIRENSMRDNGGIGIDWGIDGVSARREQDPESDPNAPVLLSGFYDAASNRTYFNVTSKNSRFGIDGHYPVLDFYGNRTADGDGEEWLGGAPVFDTAGGAYLTWVSGDHRGKWVNATMTRVPQFFSRPPVVRSEVVRFGDDSTSELSNAVKVE